MSDRFEVALSNPRARVVPSGSQPAGGAMPDTHHTSASGIREDGPVLDTRRADRLKYAKAGKAG